MNFYIKMNSEKSIEYSSQKPFGQKDRACVKASSESVDQICSNNDHGCRERSQMYVEFLQRNK